MVDINVEAGRLQDTWACAWPKALAYWSRFTKLRDPVWCFDAAAERREHLSGSFAMSG